VEEYEEYCSLMFQILLEGVLFSMETDPFCQKNNVAISYDACQNELGKCSSFSHDACCVLLARIGIFILRL
jgi:hypothetical protein